MTRDEGYMLAALEEAEKALEAGEIPVGAVVVKDDEIISRGFNIRESWRNVLGHAEVVAIDVACGALNDWRLDGCELFVTLEPCAMCAGTAVSARMKRIVFGAFDPAAGCCGSVCEINEMPFSGHIEVIGGVCESECKRLLGEFFKRTRD